MSDETNLRGSCDYLHWRHVAGAVMDVYRENEGREESGACPIKARADVWSVSSVHRRQIHDRARWYWQQRVKLGEEWWPYSEDCVARLYFRFRKRNQAELKGFEAEIDGFFGG